MKLSLCMVVKNEEFYLPQCLKSVKDVVDEIIILDTGSTDKTPQIAQQFGANVYPFNWCNDFAKARNAALSYAKGDWILVLDADEVLTPEVVPAIRDAIKDDHLILLNLIRQEIGASQSPYSLVSRLFRNHPQLSFIHPYHATVDDSVNQLIQQKPDWKIATLPQIAILHEGYQAAAIAQRNKWQMAKTVMESYFQQNPTDAYSASKLGALYIELGEIQRGMNLLKQGLLYVNASEPAVLYELHYHLGIGYRKQQNLSAAKHHYQVALQQNILPPLKIGAYNNLGNLFKEEGDLENAKKAYQTVIDIDPESALGHYNLGMTLRAMRLYPDAITAYQKAIQLNPNSAETHQNLGVVLLQIGQLTDSLEAFKTAIALHEPHNPIEAQRLRHELGSMGFQV